MMDPYSFSASATSNFGASNPFLAENYAARWIDDELIQTILAEVVNPPVESGQKTPGQIPVDT